MSGDNQTRDAKMCVVAPRLLHGANDRNRGAIRRRMQTQVSGAGTVQAVVPQIVQASVFNTLRAGSCLGTRQHAMPTALHLACKSCQSVQVPRSGDTGKSDFHEIPFGLGE